MRGGAGNVGQPARGRRFALYTYDSLGLGHLQRSLKIATRLVAEHPDSTALLLTTSPHGLDRAPAPGIDFIKLPTVARSGFWQFETTNLRLPDRAVARIREGLIGGALAAFEPDVLLVDFLPFGVWDELTPVLESYRRAVPAPRVVLGMRDIIAEPATVRTLWDREALESIARLYDRVLVYGSEAICATAAESGIEGALAGRVSYTGYVTPAERPPGREEARRRLELDADRLIVITGGGGYDARPMIERCLDAVAAAPLERVRTIAVAGPLMSAEDRAALAGAAREAGAELWWQAAEMPVLLGAADVVLTMGGYNTLTEAVASAARVLVLPRREESSLEAVRARLREADSAGGCVSAEQVLRAQAFAARGLVEAISPQAGAGALAQALSRALEAGPRTGPPALDLDGLDRIAAEIEELLETSPLGAAAHA